VKRESGIALLEIAVTLPGLLFILLSIVFLTRRLQAETALLDAVDRTIGKTTQPALLLTSAGITEVDHQRLQAYLQRMLDDLTHDEYAERSAEAGYVELRFDPEDGRLITLPDKLSFIARRGTTLDGEESLARITYDALKGEAFHSPPIPTVYGAPRFLERDVVAVVRVRTAFTDPLSQLIESNAPFTVSRVFKLRRGVS
jgi:hypothetical protein